MQSAHHGQTRKPPADISWVDPRSQPRPSDDRPYRHVSNDPSDVTELVELCTNGRVYAVERWIKAGRPLQGVDPELEPWRTPTTPLAVAIDTNQHDLALLLLCNGYRTDLEPESPLDLALRRRSWGFLELLLEWGADPTAADPDAVLDTYQLELMERFWDLGLDLTRDRSLASYLAESTRNKPAYGWAKRHCEDSRVAYALALALNEAVREPREKAVALLVWAGADPHRPVPSLRYSRVDDDPDDDRSSAVERAVAFGHGALLKYLSPSPDLDEFEELYASVCDTDALDRLFDVQPPQDWSRAIVRNISRLSWWFGNPSAHRACLVRIFEHHWGRLSVLSDGGCQQLRRDLLKLERDSDLSWLLTNLAKPHLCDERVFGELVRTPAIRRRMTRMGLGELVPSATVTRRPKVPKPAQSHQESAEDLNEAWLRSLTPETRAAVMRNRITRKDLYEEIWAEPITQVARRYGVSDVAVGKWCTRMNVPRPGRGYWARKNAGQRVKQAPLPAAHGEASYVNRPQAAEREPSPTPKIPGLERLEKPVPVPDEIGDEHPLVSQTRRALQSAGDRGGEILYPGAAPQSLDVRVAKASTDRALRLMNALIRALERAGFAVETLTTTEGVGHHLVGAGTYAVVHDARVPFFLVEDTRQVERPPSDEERADMRRNSWKRGPFYAEKATGTLSLVIGDEGRRHGHRHRWSDTEHRRLEDCLYSFLRGVLMAADEMRSTHQPGDTVL